MMAYVATTLWETWRESDDVYSNCHPMFGSVSEWFFRWLGGIRPEPEYPGFRKFWLTPSVPNGLEQINCTYHSPYGTIVSNWKKENGKVIYQMEIPQGSSAFVAVKREMSQKIQLEKPGDRSFNSIQAKGFPDGVFELNEGKYLITVQ